MKRYLPIKFKLHYEGIDLRLPRHKSVKYFFWRDLLSPITNRVCATQEYKNLRANVIASKADVIISAKWLKRWITTPLFILAILSVYLLVPKAPARVVYADPSPTPAGASVKVPLVAPITKDPKLPEIQPVAPPAPPPPPPAPVAPVYVAPVNAAPAGCGDNTYANFIYMHESGCRTNAINPIGACGIGQALPCSKMGCSLSDYACQNAFFTGYANATYGGWYNAYLFWTAHSWW